MRVIKAKQAAELLGVHVNRVYELAQLGPENGGIPSLRRMGPELRLDADELEAWQKAEDSRGIPRSGSDSAIATGDGSGVDTLRTQ